MAFPGAAGSALHGSGHAETPRRSNVLSRNASTRGDANVADAMTALLRFVPLPPRDNARAVVQAVAIGWVYSEAGLE